MESELVLCYNRGCGSKFNPKDNPEGCCRHHPGVPVFHDALKGWSCCSRRSTDFTEFLNIPGCANGRHSGEKPPEPEKKPPAEVNCPEPVEVKPQVVVKPIQAPLERPSADEPLSRLPVTVSESLKQALANRLQQMSVVDDNTDDADEVSKGASCRNSSCNAVYEGEQSDRETCVYHSGVPVFHEGMKFWSCCQRKTTDFNTFLEQEGCCTGRHVWKKKGDEAEKKVTCRFDWHQTPSTVTISVYAKVADPTKTVIEANKVTAKLNVVFDAGNSYFNKSFVLHGVIDPSKSRVNLMGTKVEVNLKKMEPGSWSSLELSVPRAPANGDS